MFAPACDYLLPEAAGLRSMDVRLTKTSTAKGPGAKTKWMLVQQTADFSDSGLSPKQNPDKGSKRLRMKHFWGRMAKKYKVLPLDGGGGGGAPLPQRRGKNDWQPPSQEMVGRPRRS